MKNQKTIERINLIESRIDKIEKRQQSIPKVHDYNNSLQDHALATAFTVLNVAFSTGICVTLVLFMHGFGGPLFLLLAPVFAEVVASLLSLKLATKDAVPRMKLSWVLILLSMGVVVGASAYLIMNLAVIMPVLTPLSSVLMVAVVALAAILIPIGAALICSKAEHAIYGELWHHKETGNRKNQFSTRADHPKLQTDKAIEFGNRRAQLLSQQNPDYDILANKMKQLILINKMRLTSSSEPVHTNVELQSQNPCIIACKVPPPLTDQKLVMPEEETTAQLTKSMS